MLLTAYTSSPVLVGFITASGKTVELIMRVRPLHGRARINMVLIKNKAKEHDRYINGSQAGLF